MTPKEACDVLRVIQWLDDKRWGIGRIRDPALPSMTLADSETQVLAHWLTYVTDRQMPAKDVWEKGWPVFESWARAYIAAPDSTLSTLKQHYSSRDSSDDKKRFKEIDGPGSFGSRYHPDDFACISRTLRILNIRFHARMSNFMIERISSARKGPKTEVVRRIAASLFLLTYDHERREREALEILGDPGLFERYYHVWEKHATEDKKRLWASLRDYTKEGSSSRDDFIGMLDRRDQNAAQFWHGIAKDFDYMNQLELPGDVWNDNPIFRENLLNPIAITLGVSTTGRVSDLARLITEAANKIDGTLLVYPEQLDVTYSFVPRMCDHEANDTGAFCREFCPFGFSGATSVYSKEMKFNTVALVLASFLTTRKEHDEVIIMELGKGTCKMNGGTNSTRGLV